MAAARGGSRGGGGGTRAGGAPAARRRAGAPAGTAGRSSGGREEGIGTGRPPRRSHLWGSKPHLPPPPPRPGTRPRIRASMPRRSRAAPPTLQLQPTLQCPTAPPPRSGTQCQWQCLQRQRRGHRTSPRARPQWHCPPLRGLPLRDPPAEGSAVIAKPLHDPPPHRQRAHGVLARSQGEITKTRAEATLQSAAKRKPKGSRQRPCPPQRMMTAVRLQRRPFTKASRLWVWSSVRATQRNADGAYGCVNARG